MCKPEHTVGAIDPQLFDRRVIEVRLQRSVAGDGCEHLAHARGLVAAVALDQVGTNDYATQDDKRRARRIIQAYAARVIPTRTPEA